MTIDPDHQPDRQRFIVQTGDEESLLEYRLLQDNGIDFTRTFVPEALRGQVFYVPTERGYEKRVCRRHSRY